MSGYNVQGQNIIPMTPGQNGVKILYGVAPATQTNTGTVTFSQPFVSPPIVTTGMTQSATGFQCLYTVGITSVTNTEFSYSKWYNNNNQNSGAISEVFNWIAIGN